MRKLAFVAIFVLLLSACQPADDDVAVPTLAVLPSITPSPTVTDTPIPTLTNTPTLTPTFTETPIPSETPTETLTPTETVPPTETPVPTDTPIPSATVDAAAAFAATATTRFLEAPRFSTFTPLPPGIIAVVRPTSTGTPEVAADVTITANQFQEEMDTLLVGEGDVNQADVSLTDAGVVVTLTARSADGFVTGRFLVRFELSGGTLNNIVIGQPVPPDEFVMQGGIEPPEEFIAAAYGAVTEAVFESFNNILNQRLGEGQHNLERLILNNGQMGVMLFVPDPGQ